LDKKELFAHLPLAGGNIKIKALSNVEITESILV
jgi:hypothetical protein